MRSLLRRRLDDPELLDGDPGDNQFFSDANLDEILNLAAQRLQRMITIVEPAAFLDITEQNLEANVWKYPKPRGAWSIQDVRMQDATSGEYRSLGEPVDPWDLDQVARSAGSTTRFGFFGRFIRLAPTPTTALTNGLQWWVVQSVEVATGAQYDNESFDFHTGLANLHILLAQEVSSPEQTGDGMDELRKLISAEQETIPLYYRRTIGPEIGFSIPGIVRMGSDGSR